MSEFIFSLLFLFIFCLSFIILFLSFYRKDYNSYFVISNIELFCSSSLLLLFGFILSRFSNFNNYWSLAFMYSLWFMLTKFTVNLIV